MLFEEEEEYYVYPYYPYAGNAKCLKIKSITTPGVGSTGNSTR
jgi:hypothetical protein